MSKKEVVFADTTVDLKIATISDINDADICARLDKLDEEMKVLRRRRQKNKTRMNKVKARMKGLVSDNLGNKRLDVMKNKLDHIEGQMDAVAKEYAALLVVQMKMPMDFLLNSYGYRNENGQHILLGYFDDEIGVDNHGHFIFDDGKCTYARLPFESHGKINALHPPIDGTVGIWQKICDIRW